MFLDLVLNQLQGVLNQLQKVLSQDSPLINAITKLLINNGSISRELVARSLRILERIVDEFAVILVDAINRPSSTTKPLSELTSGIIVEIDGLTSSLPFD